VIKQFGPYTVGDTIPEDALVGVNILVNQLYVVVGEFMENCSTVAGDTDRQDIDATGKVLTEVYEGPPIRSSVMIWSMIHDL
jgi:hypothetical protein